MSKPNIDWEKLYAAGENPTGQTTITPNGVAKGARVAPGWNRDQPYVWPQGEAEGVWKKNRTGE